MPCLSDETLSSFLAGTLDPAGLERVDAELDGCPRCRTALIALARQTAGRPTAEPAGLGRGALVDRFVVLETLGRGGGGVVYAAFDPELARKVALKFVHGGDDPATRSRVRREAQAMARLAHPNVGTVHEVGEAAAGVYLVLEHVDGDTLTAWCADARPWREVLAMFVAVGRGLGAAHRAGIVHGDVKPDNVLVDRDGRPRITDFGLAHPTDDAGAAQPGAGTPAYMAPEQRTGPATARSDQYSFCLGLAEAIYRERVGAGDRPPSGRAPGWLWPILRRGLDPAPDQRFASVDALLARLDRRRRGPRRLAAALAVAATLPVGLAIGGAWARGDATAARDAACELVTVRLDATWPAARRARVADALRASGPRDAAEIATRVTALLDGYVDQLRAASRDACVATFVRREQSAALYDRQRVCLDDRVAELDALASQLERDRGLARDAIQGALALTRLRDCERRAVAAGPELPAEPAARAAMVGLRGALSRARALRDLARYREARVLADDVLARAEAAGDQTTATAARFVAAELSGRTDPAPVAADALYQAGYAAEAARDDVTAAQVWVKLVFHAGVRLRRLDEALRLSGLARAAIARLGGDELLEAKRLRGEGLAYYEQGRLDEAWARLEPALALLERALGPDDPDVAANVADLAIVAGARRDEASAARFAERALAIRQASLGPQHPDVAASLNSLGAQAARRGDLDAAERHFVRALAILEASVGPDHIHVAYTLENLAGVELERGHAAVALERAARAVAIEEAASGPTSPDLVQALTIRGQSLASLARPAEAARDLERALALLGDSADATTRATIEGELRRVRRWRR